MGFFKRRKARRGREREEAAARRAEERQRLHDQLQSAKTAVAWKSQRIKEIKQKLARRTAKNPAAAIETILRYRKDVEIAERQIKQIQEQLKQGR